MRFLQYSQVDFYQFFASNKRYLKENLTFINKQKKIVSKKNIFCANSLIIGRLKPDFFVIVPIDAVLLRNSPI